jgi:MarR family 2-MHQ and catechol resistance regulon transcriptional repressor
MTSSKDLGRLDDLLNFLATLYQFRSTEEPTYDTLTVSQSYCLRSLYFRGPQTMSELAEDLRVQLSTMTGVIDQLEAKRLVERRDNPKDRRSLHVQLTVKGRKLYRSAHEAFLYYLEPLFRGRKSAEREQILTFLAEAIQAVQGWRKAPYGKAGRDGKKNS